MKRTIWLCVFLFFILIVLFLYQCHFWNGNPRLCGGIPQIHLPKCPCNKHKHKQSTKLIVSVVCGRIALVLVALFLMLLCWARKRKGKPMLESPFEISLLEVSYEDLLKAIENFSSRNLISSGRFGSVYKGILNEGSRVLVAVKVLNLQTSRALKSLIAECEVLKNIKHRNRVKVLAACSSTDFQGNDLKAPVYEFMIKRALEEWLHPCPGELEEDRRLNLIQRISTAIDVANALDYLHHPCHVQIVRSDLKPCNILLDGDMTAWVWDFGLPRVLSDPSHPASWLYYTR